MITLDMEPSSIRTLDKRIFRHVFVRFSMGEVHLVATI